MKQVYTIEDLESRERLDAGAAKPARLAVLGHPIAHSASPRMHQAALDAMGENLRYIRLDIEPGQVGEAFSRLRALGFIGCNVTVPHKLEALAHCEVHPDAQTLGAVNTIRFDDDATRGFNTDGPGFALAVEAEFGVKLGELKVVIAGAGGGAGQALAAQAGLAGVTRLVLVNRSLDKVRGLMERLSGGMAPGRMPGPLWRGHPARSLEESKIFALSFDDPALVEHCLACDLIVNTSSVGLKGGDPSILPEACLRSGHLVYDTIYQPPVTPLLALANRAGCRTANGLSMLVNQGALAFQHWFPGSDPLEAMRDEMKR